MHFYDALIRKFKLRYHVLLSDDQESSLHYQVTYLTQESKKEVRIVDGGWLGGSVS